MDRRTRDLVYHWDKNYGHPGNWTERNARFCLEFCIDCAFRAQQKGAYEFSLVNYQSLYDDIIEPIGEEATIWDHEARNPNRQKVLVLRAGERARGYAYDSTDNLDEWRLIVDKPSDDEKIS
jgi:hypothetical protein